MMVLCLDPCQLDTTLLVDSRFFIAILIESIFLDVCGPNLDEATGRFRDLSLRLLLNHREPENFVFDYYCPSVRGKLAKQTCRQCKKYFSTQAFLTLHRRSKVRFLKIHFFYTVSM